MVWYDNFEPSRIPLPVSLSVLATVVPIVIDARVVLSAIIVYASIEAKWVSLNKPSLFRYPDFQNLQPIENCCQFLAS